MSVEDESPYDPRKNESAEEDEEKQLQENSQLHEMFQGKSMDFRGFLRAFALDQSPLVEVSNWVCQLHSHHSHRCVCRKCFRSLMRTNVVP